MQNNAWFHLREATILAHMNGLDNEDTYLQYRLLSLQASFKVPRNDYNKNDNDNNAIEAEA